MKKQDVVLAKNVFEGLKKFLPFECGRNLGFIKNELEIIKDEEDSLRLGFSDGDKLFCYQRDNQNQIKPIFENKKHIEKSVFDKWEESKKEELFTKYKYGITWHVILPNKWEEYVTLMNKLYQSDSSTEIRKIKFEDIDLKRISNTISNDLVNDEELKDKLAFYISTLDSLGYTNIEEVKK